MTLQVTHLQPVLVDDVVEAFLDLLAARRGELMRAVGLARVEDGAVSRRARLERWSLAPAF